MPQPMIVFFEVMIGLILSVIIGEKAFKKLEWID